MKKIVFGFFAFLFFVIIPFKASAASLNAYFFYGDGCPHCAKEETFLFGELQAQYPDLAIYKYEIYNHRENIFLLQKVAQNLGAKVDGVPFLIIGDKTFVGYGDGLSSKAISAWVAECSANSCPDTSADILEVEKAVPSIIEIEPENQDGQGPEAPEDYPSSEDFGGPEEVSEAPILTEPAESTAPDILEAEEKIIHLPLLGNVDIKKFSLPTLTIIMGILDGFNPCAMWTLLFLISLLLGMEDRKRMWLLGAVFIVASASVYFFFMAAWLNLILFLGMVLAVRLIIGMVALLGGAYSLKESFRRQGNACKVVGEGKRQKTFERMKEAVRQKKLIFALGGIIVLAFAVNLVELICSAGLPAVYTQVLALNDLSIGGRYLYILAYIFFFMLDDMIIFFVAMATLEMTGLSTKYSKASRLIGGLLMILIGILLIFKPEWLMFG